MANTQYDAKILQGFADKLYGQANSIVILGVVLGMAIGGFGGLTGGMLVAVVGAIALGALGFVIGKTIAFNLKMRAQILLCQKQIEENTRKPAVIASATPVIAAVAAAPEHLAARPYYFSTGGKNSGPHSLDEMRGFRQSGRLTDEVLVAKEGDKDWQPASMFPEILF